MQQEEKPKRKQKLSWLVKFTNTVLILFILFVIAFFSLPHIVKYLNDDGQHIPDTQNLNRVAQEEKAKKKDNLLSSKNNRTKPETSDDQGELDPERDPFENIFEKYKVEPEPTTTHLIDRLKELEGVTDDNDKGLVLIDAYVQKGVDPNVGDGGSFSPAFVAASKWMVPVLKRMHKLKGVNCATRVNGLTIMHVVARNEPLNEEQIVQARRTIEYLLEVGVELDGVSDSDNFTPLMTAISFGNTAMAKILVDRGANVNGPLVPKFIVNPLIIAVRKTNIEMVKILTERGAQIMAYNKFGFSALQEAALVGFVEALQWFIVKYDCDQNAQVAEVDITELTQEESEGLLTGANLLELAVMLSNLAAVQYLAFTREVDPSLKDKNGFTAKDFADSAVRHYATLAAQDPVAYTEMLNKATEIAKIFTNVEANRVKYADEYNKEIRRRFDAELIEKEEKDREEALQEALRRRDMQIQPEDENLY